MPRQIKWTIGECAATEMRQDVDFIYDGDPYPERTFPSFVVGNYLVVAVFVADGRARCRLCGSQIIGGETAIVFTRKKHPNQYAYIHWTSCNEQTFAQRIRGHFSDDCYHHGIFTQRNAGKYMNAYCNPETGMVATLMVGEPYKIRLTSGGRAVTGRSIAECKMKLGIRNGGD